MVFKFKFIALVSLALSLTSCGDLFMNNDSKGGVNQYATADCELDTEAFSFILEKDINPEINCLNEQMNMFLDLVKTDRPGYLSRKTLKDFILTGPLDIGEDTIYIADAVFDLSFLIFGGDNGYISRANVNQLTDFLKFFNTNIIQVYKRFSSDDKLDYQRHLREAVIVSDRISLITNELKRMLLLHRDGDVDQIDTDVLLNNFFREDPETLEQIKSLMFAKRIFLGGGSYRLTHFEFDAALTKLSSLARIAYDFVKADRFNFSDEQDKMLSLYSTDIDLFRNQIYFYPDSDDRVFDLDDIFGALEKLVPDMGIDFYKYRQEVLALKAPLVGEEESGVPSEPSEVFTSKQLYRLLEHVSYLAYKGQKTYRIYELNKEVLSSKEPVSQVFEFPEDQEVANDFSRMVSDYKFVKGDMKSPIFDYKYNRNPDAYFEITALEYGIKLIMSYYGSADERARGGYHMTYDQTYALIMKIRRFLRDQGIINIGRKGGNEVAGTADNLVLMSTLFQYQSDGCDKNTVCMEVPELTEFLTGLLTAMSIKDFFVEKITSICPSVDGDDVSEENRRISVDCFRENFMTVLNTQIDGDTRSLADYMPKLTGYLNELAEDREIEDDITSSKKYMDFIKETEAFTRTCNFTYGEPLPMKPNDAFSVFAGLLNLESTFLRLDANQNGIMDGRSRRYSEVLDAYYNVYQGAIKGLVAPNGGFMEKLAKPIFQYLIKYGKVPDTSQFSSIWKFVKFLVRFNKRADASRMTIATILKTLGEESETAKKFPFKCDECMHDPDMVCEPEDGAWE